MYLILENTPTYILNFRLLRLRQNLRTVSLVDKVPGILAQGCVVFVRFLASIREVVVAVR